MQISSLFFLRCTKPVEEDDVEVAIDKVLLTYDKDTFQQLKEAKEQHKEIVDFIEHRSNEIFLLKLRSYLQEEIETKFQNSELAKLIKDLEEVEAQLDAMNVEYNAIELPERFRQFLAQLNQQEKLDLLLEMVDAIPFFPFKRMYKVMMKTAYYRRAGKLWQ